MTETINNEISRSQDDKGTNIIVKDITIVTKVKDSFVSKSDGKKVEYYKVMESADDNGENHEHSVWSATLAEMIEPNKDYRVEIQQGINPAGYPFSKITNVGEVGKDLPVRESKSRFTKNYDAMNRATGIQVAAALVAGKFAPADDLFTLAGEIANYIATGDKNKEAKKEDKSVATAAND